ncbi:hypothetical protein [Parageobacillus thermoglucosidasius]|uniref:hypothetical protein n=1 Tax=Parageobacillus thermoglucosidasius TaxID=1426 RepID=UPI001F2D75B2|nr:hypothetical protein [Parageobacillus thermoglucosidasius]
MDGNKKDITYCKKRWTKLLTDDKEDGLCRWAKIVVFFYEENRKTKRSSRSKNGRHMMKRKGKKRMIQEINIAASEWAEAVLRLQLRSCAVEAELIGWANLPPLQDTVVCCSSAGNGFLDI